ncbi:MAG: type II toxin-antitoxin system RelE/ParE family toxin, partial [Cypionkella sp.]
CGKHAAAQLNLRVVFHVGAAADLAWMRQYYTAVFPSGQSKAALHYRRTIAILADNPNIGAPCAEGMGLRSLRIARTPFCLIYHIIGDEIRVMQVQDTRSAAVIRTPRA